MGYWTIIPSDSDIVHSFGHKYLEKKRGKNGKWYYIYKRAKNKINNIIGEDQKAKVYRTKKELEMRKKHHEWSKESSAYARQYGSKKEAEDATEFNSMMANRVLDTKRELKNAEEAYSRTLLGKIDQVKDTGLKIWNNFIGLFKKEEPKKIVTNRTLSYSPKNPVKYPGKYQLITSQYTPSYKKKRRKS